MREDLLKRLADVKARVAEVKDRPSAEHQEQVDKLAAEVDQLQKLVVASDKQERRSELSKQTEDIDAAQVTKLMKLEASGQRAIDAIMESSNKHDGEVMEAQEILDRSYMIGFMLGKKPTHTKYFQRRVAHNPLLQKAIDLADLGNAGVPAAALTGWQPAEFSNRMIEQVRLATVVAQLHDTFQLPTEPFRFPLEGPDAVAHIVSEQAAIDAELTPSNRVAEALSSLGTDHLLFSTKKVGCRVATSTEVTEDSAIAVIPYLEKKLVLAHAYLRDNVTVNGDASGALDPGVTYGTNHQLLGWNGYRKIVNTLSSKISATAGLVNLAQIRDVRQEMGLLGLYPTDVTLLCGPVGYIKMLGITEVITRDKYGDQFTADKGELARIDGLPILVSGFVGGGVGYAAESLYSNGTYDGVTTSYTEILFVNRSAFTYCTRRGFQLKSREIIDTDQQVLVTLERLNFKTWYPTLKPVGALYGITK